MNLAENDQAAKDEQADGFAIELLILDQVTLILTAVVLEPLRAANRLSGRTVNTWQITTPSGQDAMTTSGIPIPANGKFSASGNTSPLLVLGSYETDTQCTPRLRHELQRATLHRPWIGGIESGVNILAMAGVLDGSKAAAHYEDIETLSTKFPDIHFVTQSHLFDDKRATAAGVIPALDLMLDVLRYAHGHGLALEVARSFLYFRSTNVERPSLINTLANEGPKLAPGLVLDPRLARAVELIEASRGEALSLDRLAKEGRVSKRHLTTLFVQAFGLTPVRYQMAVTLNRARRQLIETHLTVIEVSEQAGFANLSSFSRAYARHHGEPPSTTRKAAQARRSPVQAAERAAAS